MPGVDVRDHELGLRGYLLLRAGETGDGASIGIHKEAMRRLLDEDGRAESRTLKPVSAAQGYAYWAQSYDSRSNATIAAEEPVVHVLLRDFEASDVIDVGCGTGRHTRWLADQGHRVTGVDSSPEMLEVAARRVPEARFLLGDVGDLPLPDSSADLVVCALVLSHLKDLQSIDELARLLRPSGRLVVSNPHPFATGVLGGRAWTTTPAGERVSIPEYVHGLGDYVVAFRRAGLVPVALHEATYPGDADLLAGEPAVVVWAADRL